MYMWTLSSCNDPSHAMSLLHDMWTRMEIKTECVGILELMESMLELSVLICWSWSDKGNFNIDFSCCSIFNGILRGFLTG